MNLSITNSNAASALNSARTRMAAVPQAVKDDVKALGQALRADDLQAARGAFVELAKQAPEGATLQPGSPFAELGKSLAQGDVAAAKTAFASMVRSQIEKPSTGPIKPEQPISLPPTVSSTGGSAGGTLNAVA